MPEVITEIMIAVENGWCWPYNNTQCKENKFISVIQHKIACKLFTMTVISMPIHSTIGLWLLKHLAQNNWKYLTLRLFRTMEGNKMVHIGAPCMQPQQIAPIEHAACTLALRISSRLNDRHDRAWNGISVCAAEALEDGEEWRGIPLGPLRMGAGSGSVNKSLSRRCQARRTLALLFLALSVLRMAEREQKSHPPFREKKEKERGGWGVEKERGLERGEALFLAVSGLLLSRKGDHGLLWEESFANSPPKPGSSTSLSKSQELECSLQSLLGQKVLQWVCVKVLYILRWRTKKVNGENCQKAQLSPSAV